MNSLFSNWLSSVVRVIGVIGVAVLLVVYPAPLPQTAASILCQGRQIEGSLKSDTSSIEPIRLSEGFESFPGSVTKKFQSTSGVWDSEIGFRSYKKLAGEGKKSLQLLGGKEYQVTWHFNEKHQGPLDVGFAFIRWTRRRPFKFRVFASNGDRWQKVWTSPGSAVVNKEFNQKVRFQLPEGNWSGLRFEVASPKETGVLIDSVFVSTPKDQEIKKVQVAPFTLPALKRIPATPLGRILVETSGTGKAKTIGRVKLYSNDFKKLSKIQLFHSASNSFSSAKPISVPLAVGRPTESGSFVIKPQRDSLLRDGKNFLWVAGELNKDVAVGGSVSLSIKSVEFGGRLKKFQAAEFSNRIGIALRKSRDDGVHTYRIPGLVRSNSGTLVAVYDVRRRGSRDLPGDIDVGVSRSIDGGRTWSPMKIAMDMGDDPKWHFDGIGDPSILVDRKTGAIWIAGLWSHGNRGWFGSGPGIKPEETGQFVLVKSIDDGKTWSKPINITSQIKQKDWCLLLQGPGKGICTSDGTLVFPAQFQDSNDNKRLPRSTIIYSKDHGETWEIGTGAFDGTTEAQVVEVEPGKLMLNCRYNRSGHRVVMTTEDWGKTWKEHPTSRLSLIEPRACQGSLIDTKVEFGKQVPLLFSNPENRSRRSHITIKASLDRGATWRKQNRLLLDEGVGRGYSCMAMIDQDTVGILYEGNGADLVFQRVALKDVVKKLNESEPAVKSQLSLAIAPCFGNHMVLQANRPVTIWGTAASKKSVTVQLGDRSASAVSDASGKWQVTLPSFSASKIPTKLRVISGKQSLVISGILFGQVWICAGQSNMQWTIRKTGELKTALKYQGRDQIRLCNYLENVPVVPGDYTPDDYKILTGRRYQKGTWQIATPKTVNESSAVAWHFAGNLFPKVDQPIGLIVPAVGGTPTEAWVDRMTLAKDPTTRKLLDGNWLQNQWLGDFCKLRGRQNLGRLVEDGNCPDLDPRHPFRPGFMFESRIHPLAKLQIAGVIWYQGESNAESEGLSKEHERLFLVMVKRWRQLFSHPNLPFLFVQLPAIQRTHWPIFRETQRQSLQRHSMNLMAVSIDTGHPTNVHPSDKEPIGKRLAWLAVRNVYEKKPFQASGPLYKSHRSKGRKLIVQFELPGKQLKKSRGESLLHFEIAGKDGQFYPAKAAIVNKKEVAVWSTKVTNPVDVRYAFLPFPRPPVNLYGDLGFPAAPFTTK